MVQYLRLGEEPSVSLLHKGLPANYAKGYKTPEQHHIHLSDCYRQNIYRFHMYDGIGLQYNTEGSCI